MRWLPVAVLVVMMVGVLSYGEDPPSDETPGSTRVSRSRRGRCRVVFEEFHSSTERTTSIDDLTAVKIDDHWVVLENDKRGQFWIPREKVVQLYFRKDKAE